MILASFLIFFNCAATVELNKKAQPQSKICPPSNIELSAPVYNKKGRFMGIYRAYIPKGSLPGGENCPNKDVKVTKNVYHGKKVVDKGEVLIKKGWLDDPKHYKVVKKIPKFKYTPKKRIIVPPDNIRHWHINI
jgi:hypothetical protein